MLGWLSARRKKKMVKLMLPLLRWSLLGYFDDGRRGFGTSEMLAMSGLGVGEHIESSLFIGDA